MVKTNITNNSAPIKVIGYIFTFIKSANKKRLLLLLFKNRLCVTFHSIIEPLFNYLKIKTITDSYAYSRNICCDLVDISGSFNAL